MTTHTFVGPDGKAYAEHKPEEGGFLSYFDGYKWLITGPVRNSMAHSCHYYFGEQLPTSASQWVIRLVSSNSRFPAYIESC